MESENHGSENQIEMESFVCEESKLPKPRRRIKLNVGGMKHETYYETLQRIPGTRLAELSEDDPHYDPDEDIYFFDRHPDVFESILNFYRIGELHIQMHHCYTVIQKELKFWGINDQSMERCCFIHYNSYASQRKTLEEFEKAMSRETYKDQNQNTLKAKIWDFVDDPHSSIPALIYMTFTIFVIVVSITQMILTTISSFRIPLDFDDWASIYGVSKEELVQNMYYHNASLSTTAKPGLFEVLPNATKVHPSVTYLNIACISFFTFEYAFRFIFSPNKKRFIFDGYNIIDFITLIAGYVGIISAVYDPSRMHKEDLYDIVHNLQTLRVFRLFRLMKYIKSLAVLLYTVRSSLWEVFISFIFVLVLVITFGSTMYFVEQDNREMFPNIMVGIWWAIVTMTTVGYGDVVPTTTLGYFVGAVCAFFGILAVALTVPTIVTNATLFFSYMQYQPKNRKIVKMDMEFFENETFVSSPKDPLRSYSRFNKSSSPTRYSSKGYNNNYSP